MADRFRQLGLGDEDVAASRASGMPADALDDWLTDRVARRPSGARAREVYDDEELAELFRSAGFDDVTVSGDDGGQLLGARA